MSFDPHALKLFIDGSCFNNPGGNGGFAAWAEYPSDWCRPDERLEEVGFHETTNQRMELRACIWAHQWIRENGPSLRVSRIQIITDSQYVYKFWRMAERWRQSGWRLVSGRPTENSDLWKEFLSVRSKYRGRVDIEWTPGKKTEITRAVDKSAKRAAKEPSQIDRGFRSGKVGRTRNRVAGVAALFPASGQEAVVRVYYTTAYRRAGGENKFKFQLFSQPLQDFSEKFLAYASPETGALLHRQRVYRLRFNVDPKYPIAIDILQEFPNAASYLQFLSEESDSSTSLV
jgi:ribonuclease HI